MSLSTGESRPNQFRLAKILIPFLTFNIVASLVWLLWPIALPIFCAQFCLLSIWSAWGPGDFWKRFGSTLAIGAVLFLSQIYLWLILFSVTSNFRIVTLLIQWLFSAWILAQVPLWAMRYIWQWRITDQPTHDLGRFSVHDNMIGITMICAAFGSCRWATDALVDQYGPFGFDKAVTFYGGAMLEFYFLIGLATFGTYLVFRLPNLSTMIVPMLVAGCALAAFSAWLWFAIPERWVAAGMIWVGTIIFSWALILPIHHTKNCGYRLYQGIQQIGQGSIVDSPSD